MEDTIPNTVPVLARSKAYVCTAKQLEALKRAREARKQKKIFINTKPAGASSELQEESITQMDFKHVANEPPSPVEVVRDDQLLKEFAASAGKSGISVSGTELGMKKRDRENKALLGNFELSAWDLERLSFSTPAVVAAAGVAAGVGIFAWRRRNELLLSLSLAAKAKAPSEVLVLQHDPEPEQFVTHLRAPWER